jgi:hypothetical protein
MRNACRASVRKRRSARTSPYRWSVVSLRKTLRSCVSSRSHARSDAGAWNVRPSTSASPKASRFQNGSWSASTSPRSTIERKKAVDRARGALHIARTGIARSIPGRRLGDPTSVLSRPSALPVASATECPLGNAAGERVMVAARARSDGAGADVVGRFGRHRKTPNAGSLPTNGRDYRLGAVGPLPSAVEWPRCGLRSARYRSVSVEDAVERASTTSAVVARYDMSE